MDENTLILYYYGELTGAEKQALENALETDAGLAERYRQLEHELSGLVDEVVPAVRPHVTERWHDTIDRAASRETRTRPRSHHGFNLLSFVWGAAITASLAVGIAIGVYISGNDAQAPTMQDTVVHTMPQLPTGNSSAFTRGLQVHLRDSRRGITSLAARSSADRALLIMDILEQNRLFERAAEQKNSPQLARVLRAFEPILVRLAAEDLAPEDEEALRAQLAFELNVMLTKLTSETSEEPETI